MEMRQRRIATIRLYVAIGSCAGLAMVALLAVARSGNTTWINNIAFTILFSVPFGLAIFSLRPDNIQRQRRIWLASSVLAAMAGLPLIFNGVGFFILGIAFCYGWAFVATRRSAVNPGS